MRFAPGGRGHGRQRDILILPEHIQEEIKKLPDDSYGVKRIVVVLDDGTTFGGVYVAWAKEVVWVEGRESVPFDVTRVAEVRHDSRPDRGSEQPGT